MSKIRAAKILIAFGLVVSSSFQPSPSSGAVTSKDSVISLSNSTLQISSAIDGYHTCALLDDSTVKCWGSNWAGQLGNGSYENQSTPQSVTSLNNVIQVAVGTYHSCALIKTGEIKCWGSNHHGQLGNNESGPDYDSNTPVKVVGISNAIQISSGQEFSCALLKTRKVKCWGYNTQGALGIAVSGAEPKIYSKPVAVVRLSNVRAIDSGRLGTCAVISDGTVRCWGSNDLGQLGISRDLNSTFPEFPVKGIKNAVEVGLSESHACALLETKKVVCWGSNWAGQLGNGVINRTQPLKIYLPKLVANINGARKLLVLTGLSCVILKKNIARCWGMDHWQFAGEPSGFEAKYEPTPKLAFKSLSGVIDISGGPGVLCVVSIEKASYCDGNTNNEYGQLGNGLMGSAE